MVTKKLFFMDCHLAGRKYHDADEVWDDLKVGTTLRLERDKENRFDPYAVMVVFEKEKEDYLLGTSLVVRMRLFPIFSKWDGTTSLSVASVKSTKRHTQRSRYT